jgi:hypothetical protein
MMPPLALAMAPEARDSRADAAASFNRRMFIVTFLKIVKPANKFP